MRRLLAALFAAALVAPSGVVSAAGAIKPDSACADESEFKSLKGDTTAELTVINNSDETVKVWWLNYDGERVFYADLAPHTSYVQETWLTHPWVISSAAGDCYRFLVMNSRMQSVTVAPEVPDPASTVVPATGPPATARPAATGPATTTQAVASGAPSGPTTPATATDFLPLLIMGVLATIFAVLAGAAATGRLPGVRRGPR